MVQYLSEVSHFQQSKNEQLRQTAIAQNVILRYCTKARTDKRYTMDFEYISFGNKNSRWKKITFGLDYLTFCFTILGMANKPLPKGSKSIFYLERFSSAKHIFSRHDAFRHSHRMDRCEYHNSIPVSIPHPWKDLPAWI